MATLIHLNGAPGVGKSTIADRYLVDHPGVLSCDIDRLRCLVGGWADDFDAVGGLVRPVALSIIRTHLDGGRDVVLPQMLANEDERARFRAVAVEAGHRYVHVLLQTRADQAGARFYRRSTEDRLHAVIRDVVDSRGGVSVIEDLERCLAQPTVSSDAVTVDASGDVERTYRAVIAAVGNVVEPR